MADPENDQVEAMEEMDAKEVDAMAVQQQLEASADGFANEMLTRIQDLKRQICKDFDRLTIDHATELRTAFRTLAQTEQRTRDVIRDDIEMIGYQDDLFVENSPPGTTAQDMIRESVRYILWKYLDARTNGCALFQMTDARSLHLQSSQSRAALNPAWATLPYAMPAATEAQNGDYWNNLQLARSRKPVFNRRGDIAQPKKKR